MTVEISVLADLGVLEVAYSADDVTAEDLVAQREQVSDAIARSGLEKVLIDASALARFPSVVTIFEHNAVISTERTLREARFAVVCDALGENERFLETTGVNRGVQIKCFTSEEAALSWLGV